MPNPVETYLRDLFYIRSFGSRVEETSYYGLRVNREDVQRAWQDAKACIINLKNQVAGIPAVG